jgi:DNA-binding protein YbaB
MSNDAMSHQMNEVFGLLQEQMADIAAMQKKQAALMTSAAVADGLVEVTVNAHGQLVKTVIDESYLDEHEFEELANHITEAARAAAGEATRRVSEMMTPINERRKAFPALSEIVEGAPDLRDLMAGGLEGVASAGPRQDSDGGGGDGAFPIVKG